MSLINLVPSQLDTLRSPFMQRGFHPEGNTLWVAKTIEASITYSNGGVPAFTVTAQKRYDPGRRGNELRFGCIRVDGARYVLFLYTDADVKLNGTLSTVSEGAAKSTAVAIVNKINNTPAMSEFIRATLHTDAINIDYTGHTAVNLANTDPLTGGRG